MEEQLQAILAETESALATVEARSQLDQVKASILGGNGKLTALMKGIASVPKEERPAFGQAVNKTKKQIEDTLSEFQSEKEPDSLDNRGLLKEDAVVDTTVFIPSLNMEGKIVHPPDKQDQVKIVANGITLVLKLSQLQLSLTTEKSSHQKNRGVVSQVETLQSIQIDLRGKRVEEAIFETEKFLDTAILSGVGFVNILHGKGTGALMEAIHDYLKEQSFVIEYHFADNNQGGAGMTVVNLK